MKQHERMEYIAALFKATRQEIRSGAESYISFLTFASRNYKYAYHQQLLFYAQNPNATAIATFDIWDELRNPVKRGSTALWALSDDGVSPQHYFDISDTIFPNKFRPWVSLEEKYKLKVIDALKESLEKFDVNLPKNQNIDTTLENIVIQYAQELLSAGKIENLQQYTEFFIRSVQFGVSRRMGIAPHVSASAFDSVSQLPDAQLTQIQTAVCGATSKILKSTERIIKLEREAHHENKNDKRSETPVLGGNGDLFTYREEDRRGDLPAGRGNNDVQTGAEPAGSPGRDVRRGTADNASRELPKLLGGTDNNDAGKRLLEAEERGVREALSEGIRTAHGQIEQDADGQLYGGVAAAERGGGAGAGNSDERNAGGSSYVQKPGVNKITVLVVEPQKAPYQAEIPTGVEALQNIIGGNITITELADGVDVISADEYPAEPTVNRLVKGFPFYETFVIAGVNYADGETVSLSPAQLKKYSKQFESPVFEISNAAKNKTIHTHREIVDAALLNGSGVEGGKKRIYTFFRNNIHREERAAFLKHEYGYGGTYVPLLEDNSGHFNASYSPSGLTIDYRDDELQFVDKFTWTQVSTKISKLISGGVYPVPDDWVEQEASFPESYSVFTAPDASETDMEQLDLFSAQQYDSIADKAPAPMPDADVETSVDAADVLTASPINYTFPVDFSLPNGQRAKYLCNLEAIRLVNELEGTGAQPTDEQREVLAHYVGWGGIPQAFDEKNESWGEGYSALKAELDEKDYECARASVNNAHYTTPLVIRGMYKALAQFGFESGNIFEPALGIGNFYGALPKQMAASKLYGTEIDNITGKIAKYLYPAANIQIAGFETTQYPENYMDVGIGNVPFGTYSVFDPKYNKLNLNIHDYFFAKSLDVVRPSGILAFITSKGTLDKANPTFRKYLAQRAELLGAIRLPNNAFKQNANTEVTTDIIFLKKREQLVDDEPAWLHLGATEDGVPVNLYYLQNPRMMLGKMVFNTMYGGADRKETALEPDGRDLETALNEAVFFLPAKVYELQIGGGHELLIQDTLPASPSVRNYSYTAVDGEVYYRENSVMYRQKLDGVNQRKLTEFCGLKNCIRHVLSIQKDGCGDDELADVQKELNTLYDNFVERFGYITKKANYRQLKKDVEYFLASSLENVDADTGKVTKRDIFTKRTIQPKHVITEVDCAKDALSVSLSQKGFIDFEYMQALYNVPLAKLIEELDTLIYLNPKKYNKEDRAAGYETESEYLSGNVRAKLVEAQKAAEAEPELFAKNVEALEKVQPEDIRPDEIEVHLGSNFIELKYYNQFIYETLKPPRTYQGNDPKRHIFVRYNHFNNSYFITNKSMDFRSVLAKDTYGTERLSAYSIIENCLNLQSSVVKDNVAAAGETPCYVLNPTETTLAKQKQELLQEKFKEWLFSDVTRRNDIVRCYNDKYNSIRLREYDGSLLAEIDGMNPEWHLRPKQADAVARGIFSGRNALFAHCVGAGKTLTCATVIMERKRLGLSNKTMIVVPNTLTDQWKNAFLDYFPAANLLVATKSDFEKANRQTFISKIATGDYDAVILGFSQFERIPVSDTLMTREVKEQISYITECIKQIKDENGEKWTVKQAEGEKKKLERQLKKLMQNTNKDKAINFEDLGVDSLVVDEAHYYKNCAVFTKLRNVAGVGNNGAQKSTDLLLKIKYLSEQNNHNGCVYFATGTPISNSMTEMFTMERYLMNDTLQEMGFDYFDNWVSVFGETVTSMELKPEGNGYRPRTRLARFVNLPELMTAFRMVSDIQTAGMLNLPKPKLIGGKAQTVVAPPSPALLNFLQIAALRADNIRNGNVDPTKDNMLKLTGDARRAGTDIRLLDPSLPDDPNSKVNLCVHNVLDIYNNTADVKGVQLVFCDISTPNPSKFNVYDDMRTKWIAAGIPAKEIAFIHNANNEIQLAKLFSQLRMGQVRILVGSSAKCGAGMNVQDRLVALHHVDAPWTPKDIEQREGRILRPGNNNEEVYIGRYVTEKSFDSYMWSILENKQRFISQIMTSKTLARVCEDIDETVLSYAEIKAIANGNPKIKEKMEVDMEVSKLRVLKNGYSKKRFRLQDEFQVGYPKIIAANNILIKRFQSDISLRSENTTKDFSIRIDGKIYTEKEDAGELLIKRQFKVKEIVGSYWGFELEQKLDFGAPYFRLCGDYNYRVEISDSGIGMVQRLDNALGGIEKQITKLEFENAQNMAYIEQSQLEYAKPFEKEDALKQLLERQVELEKELQLDEKPVDETAWTDEDIKTVEDEQELEDEEGYEFED